MLNQLRSSLNQYFGAWVTGITIVLLICIAGFAFLANDKKVVMLSSSTEGIFLKSNNVVEHWLGLSWRKEEAFEDDVLGMIFLFDREKERTFWMRGMQFDLDVIWVKDGRVVKIDSNVPAPTDGEEPARMTSAPFEVDAVIEVPAGQAAALGIKRGRTLDELK